MTASLQAGAGQRGIEQVGEEKLASCHNQLARQVLLQMKRKYPGSAQNVTKS